MIIPFGALKIDFKGNRKKKGKKKESTNQHKKSLENYISLKVARTNSPEG